MPYFPNTPEAHIAFLSRTTKTLCRGISNLGNTCNRLVALSKNGKPNSGIIAVIEGEEAFYCDKHKEQAQEVVFRHTRSFVRERKLGRRGSMDTVIEDIELLVAGGENGGETSAITMLSIAEEINREHDPFVEEFAERLQISEMEASNLDPDSDGVIVPLSPTCAPIKPEPETKHPIGPPSPQQPNDNCYTRVDQRALFILWRFFFCLPPNGDSSLDEGHRKSVKEAELKPAATEAVAEDEDASLSKEVEFKSMVAAVVEDDVEIIKEGSKEDAKMEFETTVPSAVKEDAGLRKDENEMEWEATVTAVAVAENECPKNGYEENSEMESEAAATSMAEEDTRLPKDGDKDTQVVESLAPDGLSAVPSLLCKDELTSFSPTPSRSTLYPDLYPFLLASLVNPTPVKGAEAVSSAASGLSDPPGSFTASNLLDEDDIQDIIPAAEDKVTQYAFSLISPHLTPKTVHRLKQELAKPSSSKDEPGYIYVFRLNDGPISGYSNTVSTPDADTLQTTENTLLKRAVQAGFSSSPRRILLKIGRASNVQRRLHQWNTLCGYNLSLLRYYPHVSSTMSSSPAAQNTEWLNLQVGRKVYNSHRVEHLIHLELRDVEGSNFVHICESCGREHKEFFWIEATRAGLEGVNEVISRWVEYAEKTWGTVTSDMKEFSTPTPRERNKRRIIPNGTVSPIKSALLEAMAKQFSEMALKPKRPIFGTPKTLKPPFPESSMTPSGKGSGKDENLSSSHENDAIIEAMTKQASAKALKPKPSPAQSELQSPIKDSHRGRQESPSPELSPSPSEIGKSKADSPPRSENDTVSETIGIRFPALESKEGLEFSTPVKFCTPKRQETNVPSWMESINCESSPCSEQDAILKAIEVQFSIEFRIPIKFRLSKIYEPISPEASVSPNGEDAAIYESLPSSGKENVD